jgi:hypothetical protein
MLIITLVALGLSGLATILAIIALTRTKDHQKAPQSLSDPGINDQTLLGLKVSVDCDITLIRSKVSDQLIARGAEIVLPESGTISLKIRQHEPSGEYGHDHYKDFEIFRQGALIGSGSHWMSNHPGDEEHAQELIDKVSQIVCRDDRNYKNKALYQSQLADANGQRELLEKSLHELMQSGGNTEAQANQHTT